MCERSRPKALVQGEIAGHVIVLVQFQIMRFNGYR